MKIKGHIAQVPILHDETPLLDSNENGKKKKLTLVKNLLSILKKRI